MNKKINKCKFCNQCPANTGTGASPFALKAIELVKEDPNADLSSCCPYYINSKAHDYCFWKFIDQDLEPMYVQTIATLLCLNPSLVRSAQESGIRKIKEMYKQGVPEIVDFIDLIRSKVVMQENLSDFAELSEEIQQQLAINNNNEVEEITQKSNEKRRKPLDMPVHRGGKKTDIYGIYSEKALKRHHGLLTDEED